MNVLVIDVGGTHVKMLVTGAKAKLQFDSSPRLTAAAMVKLVKRTTREAGWKYEAISMGYPGPVVHNKIVREPFNLGSGWTKLDFRKAFGKPIKLINDAAMQALGSYDGGNMLFLGLGTGLGSAMIMNSTVVPLELAHLPYKKDRSYEDYVGLRGLNRLGHKRWRKEVAIVTEQLKAAMQAEYVVYGGGNARLLKNLPDYAQLGQNSNAFRGGFRLWEKSKADPKRHLFIH